MPTLLEARSCVDHHGESKENPWKRGRERPRGKWSTLGRRRFLLGGLSATLLAARGGRADLRVGLVLAPGPLAPSILRGAKLGIAEADSMAQMFGKKIELALPSVPGPEKLARVASRLVKEGVSVLVGGGDERAAETLREVAQDGKALFLNVGSAADRLRTERCDRHTFHVFASVEMHVGALGAWLIEEKKARRWAVLTESDELRRAVSALAEARGATVVEGALAASGTTDCDRRWSASARPRRRRSGSACPPGAFRASSSSTDRRACPVRSSASRPMPSGCPTCGRGCRAVSGPSSGTTPSRSTVPAI